MAYCLFPCRSTINFSIPGPSLNVPTIAPPVPLPIVEGDVVLDGTTQGIFGLVELEGHNNGAFEIGIELKTNCTVKGLVINRFGTAGIRILAASCTVQGCYIGTDVSGTTRLPNGSGIVVSGNSATIGGTTEAARNIISGNASNGIEIVNSSDHTGFGLVTRSECHRR